jgi:3-methyl-2-oxobutanoate hydroxymethyltransferase
MSSTMSTDKTAKVTPQTLARMKAAGQRIGVITAYDWMFATLFDAAGADVFIVGDSLAMSVQGHRSTLPVTKDDILYHTRAVARGTQRAMIVADMPFLSYEISVEEAVRTAGRFIQEGGADAVKIEGGQTMVPVIDALLRAKIPVMGHIGLTPQSTLVQSGLKLPGKTRQALRQIVEDALSLEQAGVFAIVLEAIPAPLSRLLQRRVGVPVIGIGSGLADGQVLVHTDLLGLPSALGHQPRFAKRYADLASVVTQAVTQYIAETKAGTFPAAEHVYPVNQMQLEALKDLEAEFPAASGT